MRRFVFATLLGMLLLLGALVVQRVGAEGNGDDPYPCHICWYASPITYHRFKPEDCGEKWKRKGYRYWVVCRQLPNKVWERYVWYCPICKDPDPMRKDGGIVA